MKRYEITYQTKPKMDWMKPQVGAYPVTAKDDDDARRQLENFKNMPNAAHLHITGLREITYRDVPLFPLSN